MGSNLCKGLLPNQKNDSSLDLQWGAELDLTPSFVVSDKLIPGGEPSGWQTVQGTHTLEAREEEPDMPVFL